MLVPCLLHFEEENLYIDRLKDIITKLYVHADVQVDGYRFGHRKRKSVLIGGKLKFPGLKSLLGL